LAGITGAVSPLTEGTAGKSSPESMANAAGSLRKFFKRLFGSSFMCDVFIMVMF
jgi:hypothetical protein